MDLDSFFVPLGEEAKDLGFRGLSVVIIFLTSVVIILIPVYLDPFFFAIFCAIVCLFDGNERAGEVLSEMGG